MSAFILGNKHITAMLQAAAPRYPGDCVSYYWKGELHPMNGNTQAIGQKLVDENFRSVNYRYSETETAHTFKIDHSGMYTPVEIVKACNCYQYQSCESPDWEDTEAHAIVNTLRERAINALPGYEKAGWVID